MPATKKVIVFIVEGKTEEVALGGVMSGVLAGRDIRFQLVQGDIGVRASAATAKKLVTKTVSDILDRYRFQPSDVEEVVHIMDTDGCFIPDEAFWRKESGHITYCEDHVLAQNLAETKKRFAQKKAVFQLLAGLGSIAKRAVTIPYRVFYMSRNMEHALWDRGGKSSNEVKNSLASKFDRKFASHVSSFRTFINDSSIATPGSYAETWDYIMQGTRSLRRGSNLHILVNSYPAARPDAPGDAAESAPPEEPHAPARRRQGWKTPATHWKPLWKPARCSAEQEGTFPDARIVSSPEDLGSKE